MITLDGITFSGDMSGQKKLAEHRKKYYTRVVTGYKDAYDRKYTGPPDKGGQGWGTSKIKEPTYGYIRNQKPLPQASAPAPKPAPAPAPAPTISNEAKQFRADTMKILKQADELRNQFLIDQKNAAAAAEARARKEEAARVAREKVAAETAAVRSANEARSGRAASLQIQPAEQVPTTAGTQAFKRRQNQFNVSGAYGGLSKIASGMVNL